MTTQIELRPDTQAESGAAEPGSCVILSDGTSQKLDNLTREELTQLQWEQERDFATRIKQSELGSSNRAKIVGHAYETVPKIFALRNTNSADPMRMGHDPRYDRLVVQLLDQQKKQGLSPRFFEIGFGSGSLLQSVAQANYDISGIEVSLTLREHACAELGASHRDRLLLGDFLSCDFTSESEPFSLIYWNDVFEHLPTDETSLYLKKIHQLLAPGGQLVTITPNWHSRPQDVTGDILPVRSQAQGLHLKEYTLREMSELLRQAGFRKVATPLILTHGGFTLCGDGLEGLKRFAEPALEALPYRLAHKLCRGFSLMCTIATK